MCILSYLPPNVPADEDGLYNGGVRNPDGHGWALIAEEVIVTGKSLDLGEALDGFARARRRHPQGPALFHSRLATHGSVSVSNVHPFQVGGSPLTVVAHNGILPDDAHPGQGDDRSDTRKFADEILSTRFRRLDRRQSQQALARWCGRANKLVILTVDPRYRAQAYIVNSAAGQWDSKTGIWHSNSGYSTAPIRRLTSPRGGYQGDDCLDFGDDLIDGNEQCYICGALWSVGEHGYCLACDACVDCGEIPGDCQCWNSRCEWAALRRRC